jgi:cyclophilin family peptidyl-prolyl cis-trans isomerase
MCGWACRYSDPDSATSSFSILLGSAPHLDEQVALLFAVSKEIL